MLRIYKKVRKRGTIEGELSNNDYKTKSKWVNLILKILRLES